VSRVPTKIKVGMQVFYPDRTKNGKTSFIFGGIVSHIIGTVAQISPLWVHEIRSEGGVGVEELLSAVRDLKAGAEVPIDSLRSVEEAKYLK
jgi:hypothetical protein